MRDDDDGISQRPEIQEHHIAINRLREMIRKTGEWCEERDALNYAIDFLEKSTDDLK